MSRAVVVLQVAALAAVILVPSYGFAADRVDSLPDFRLHNWDGTELSADSLGGVAVVVPTYAKCVYACPMITFLLQQLDEDLGHPEHVRYLHVSINPSADTAEEIRLHFAKHEIDPVADPRWLFANGPAENISRLLEESGIEIERTLIEEGVLIDHNIRVWVLSPEGSTLATFDTYFWPEEEMRHALQRR